MKTKIIILASLLIVNCGCKKSAGTAAAPATGSGGITLAQLPATATSSCVSLAGGSMGNDFLGASYRRILTFDPSGNYYLYVFFYSTNACGGSNFLNYHQAGVVSAQGLATAPVGASQLIFTATTNIMTVYATGGASLADDLNTACGLTTGNGFSDTVFPTSLSMTARNCTTGGANIASMAFASTNTTYNVITLSGTVLSMGTPPVIWIPGTYSSYPASVGGVLYNY